MCTMTSLIALGSTIKDQVSITYNDDDCPTQFQLWWLDFCSTKNNIIIQIINHEEKYINKWTYFIDMTNQIDYHNLYLFGQLFYILHNSLLVISIYYHFNLNIVSFSFTWCTGKLKNDLHSGVALITLTEFVAGNQVALVNNNHNQYNNHLALVNDHELITFEDRPGHRHKYHAYVLYAEENKEFVFEMKHRLVSHGFEVQNILY